MPATPGQNKFRVWLYNDTFPEGKMFDSLNNTVQSGRNLLLNLACDVLEIGNGQPVWARVGNHGIHLMQCTGLKDCNGEDIYDYDILKKGGENALVFWDEVWAMWKVYKLPDGEDLPLYEYLDSVTQIHGYNPGNPGEIPQNE
jgi:YopX protein